MVLRNVLGGELADCSIDPVTGFTRTGRCEVTPEDVGVHGICVVLSAEFLTHQVQIGNDLVTPRPEWHFPGLVPGDRWCVVALRWLQSERVGYAAPVVLASTHESVLEVVPLEVLRKYAADVPDDPSSLED
ncbi:MAG: DUF2237 domain-containing protein [Ornithinimicrobium sp.]|uniref:DUF2237 family protein n=1 Tax=Ornithinimicrobium sp. TaxID=1977084 RepID=UPI0026DEF9B0|nr:DUF2237 domain-containing protein [Ornithinimicrobium sp.]MDO5740792.1 DUF2237 domain-containing protein [Ornithinimicrobium sp.]